MKVHEALAHVMADVQAVGKGDRNKNQGYNFRGVDAVVNAVGPALRTHGVLVVPLAESVTYESYTTSGGTAMRGCVVKIRWVFYGPEGDTLECVTFGESSDAGDKSTPKAHSVAFRTALLEALCIPTDEPDPDESSHERAMAPPPVAQPTEDEIAAGQGWESDAVKRQAFDVLKLDTGNIPDADAKKAVVEWVRHCHVTYGTFTESVASRWREQIDQATPA